MQQADDLKIRFTDEGKQYPPPAGTVAAVRFFGAGFPDYPWLFATDGEFTRSPRWRRASSRPSRTTCGRSAT